MAKNAAFHEKQIEAPDTTLNTINHSRFQGRTYLTIQKNTSALSYIRGQDNLIQGWFGGWVVLGVLALFPSFCSYPFRKLLVKNSHVS